MERATFGAGCFWGVEATFARLAGVTSTAVGYCGGTLEDPTYEDVCTGQTGYAEVVDLRYDPAVISYEAIVDVFFAAHDPTTPDRQGPDIGTQYRSVAFFYSRDQESALREAVEKLEGSGRYRSPIVTEILPATSFYRAEEYHQCYLEKRGLGSCGTP